MFWSSVKLGAVTALVLYAAIMITVPNQITIALFVMAVWGMEILRRWRRW